MIVLGVDPGFAKCGYAIVDVQPYKEVVEETGVITTVPSPKKLHILSTDDNVRRLREISCALETQMTEAQVVCCEAMSWPRNASSIAKIGMVWGVIVSLADSRSIPILQASPQDIKIALCGRKTATKDDVISAIDNRYPDMPPFRMPKSSWEHQADAVGAVVACLNSQAMMLARGLQ